MSHFNRRKSKFNNATLIQKALERMGYTVEASEAGDLVLKGWRARRGRLTANAHIAVRNQGRYDFGFTQGKDGNYSLIMESMDDRNYIDGRPFLQEFGMNYVRANILDTLPDVDLGEPIYHEDGSITFNATCDGPAEYNLATVGI